MDPHQQYSDQTSIIIPSSAIPQYPPSIYPPPPPRTRADGMRMASTGEVKRVKGSSSAGQPNGELRRHSLASDDNAESDEPQKKGKAKATGRKRGNTQVQPHHHPSDSSFPSFPLDHDVAQPSRPPTNGRSRSHSQIQQPSGACVAASSVDSPPAVLVREKKQKACANCRRAKLKCIVEEGLTECVRCLSRKERCIFYPRAHVSVWHNGPMLSLTAGRGLAADLDNGPIRCYKPSHPVIANCLPHDPSSGLSWNHPSFAWSAAGAV